MAYSGYRLQINGVIFPNTNMAPKSYKKSTSPRVCEKYTDTLGIDHETYYPTTKTVISFTVREHNKSEHAELASFFSTRANVPVSFYDEDTDAYVSGNFKIKDFEWAQDYADASNIEYGTTSITLEEY